jgi:hypothetical protein
LARGAKWCVDDHECFALHRAGALQNSQSPVDTEGDGDGPSWNPPRCRFRSILLTRERKIDASLAN